MKRKNKKNTKKIYISFFGRIIFCTLFFVVLLLIGIEFIINSLKIEHKEQLYFKETGNVTYSVCLMKNDFFEEECLNPNMTYIASLIKNISLNFNYQLTSNKNDLIKSMDYEILAKLIIKNNETSAKYFEKEYILQEKTNTDITKEDSTYTLNKKVNIDYEYYNNVANKFKAQYGVDFESYLEVSLNIYNDTNAYYNIPNSGRVIVQIPLSQKAIEIKLDTQEINKTQNKTLTTKDFNVENWLRLILGIILILFSFYFISSLLYLLRTCKAKNNPYDKYIKRILKEYDRLIVETSTFPTLEDYNILKINNFNELIDVRDNLRLPIMYYEVIKHEKAHFYILHENNLYLYTLNNVDIKKKK